MNNTGRTLSLALLISTTAAAAAVGDMSVKDVAAKAKPWVKLGLGTGTCLIGTFGILPRLFNEDSYEFSFCGHTISRVLDATLTGGSVSERLRWTVLLGTPYATAIGMVISGVEDLKHQEEQQTGWKAVKQNMKNFFDRFKRT